MMTDLAKLTRSQLQRLKTKLEQESSALLEAFITAGRGWETHSETMAKAKEPDADLLTIRFADHAKAWSEMRAEEQARWAYHGTLHRIKTQR